MNNKKKISTDSIITTLRSETSVEKFPVGKHNNFEDPDWFIYNNVNNSYKVIRWNNYNLHPRWLRVVKKSLLNFCGGYTSFETQDIYNSGSSLKTFLGSTSRFFNTIDLMYGLEKKLCELKLSDLRDLMVNIGKGKNDELLSFSTMSDYAKLIQRYRNDFERGENSDGIMVSLPRKFIEYCFRDVLDSNGLTVEQWRRGGSFQTIPASVAMLLLARCIEISRSPETKLTEIYCKYAREIGFDQISFWSNANKKGGGLMKGIDWLIGSKICLHPEVKAAALRFHHEVSQPIFDGIRFNSKLELSNYLRLIYDYNTTCFILLTGYRLIEVRHICGGDIKFIGLDGVEFPTTPRKTKHFPTVREVSSLTADMVKLLLSCSFRDKIAEDLPIFNLEYGNGKLGRAFDYTPDNTMRHRLVDCWNDFVANVNLQDEVAELGISPHALRHAWVDVALRCNVPEKGMNVVTEEIRHHLRHRFGSNWTRRYMDGKFTKEHMRELEENYFSDLSCRLIGDESSDFYGPIVKRIRKSLVETNFIESSDVMDVEEKLKELSSELVSINTHPWGLCILMKDTETQAKCYDRNTGLPETEERSSFENCSGCTHRLSHKSNFEYIQRYVISHKEFLEGYPLRAKVLRKASEDAVDLGEKILKEMSSEH
jgi:integrase